MSESLLQQAFFEWVFFEQARDWRYQLIFSYPIGGKREIATAKKMKKEGAKKGVFDVLCLVPSRGKSGLAIEFKVGKNQLTLEQKQFRELLLAVGWEAMEFRSLETAITYVRDWIGASGLPGIVG